MTTHRYDIRAVGNTDADLVAVHRFPDAGGDEVRLATIRRSYAEWLRPRIADGHYIGRLVEVDGQVIAGAGAVLLDWGATWLDPNPVKARLVNVFTAPEFRRRGLARSVVDEVLEVLRHRGVRSVSLAATPEAENLYVSLGFERKPGEFVMRYP